MEGFLSLLFLGTVICIIIFCVKSKKTKKAQQQENESKSAEENEKKEQEELKVKWEKIKNEISTNGLPILTVETLHLTKNEICHFVGDASFCKIKRETVGYEGGSRGVSFRLAKGINFRIGNYQGHYIKSDYAEKTNGTIYLTNKRIIFTALKNSSIIKYKDIINLNAYDNMLQIQTENKVYMFQIVDSLTFMVILEYLINKTEKGL